MPTRNPGEPGSFLLDAARADEINAQTVGGINQYLYGSLREQAFLSALSRQKRHQRELRYRQARDERILHHPTNLEVASGDALNAAVAAITNHGSLGSASRFSKTEIAPHRFHDITFLNAAQGVSINLHQLLTQEDWPRALCDDLFVGERNAYQAAIEEAAAQAWNGVARRESLQRVDKAVERLRVKLDREPPLDFTEAQAAKQHVETMFATAAMLRRPHVVEMLAEIKTTRLRTLGHLLDFMFKYNVQFGPSMTPQGRQAYQDFYPILADARDQVTPPTRRDQRKIAAQ